MPLRGNKGEWSEFYAFLKLLSEGKIYAADKDLNKNEKLFYLILKIIRGSVEDFEYLRKDKIIIQKTSGEIISELSIEAIANYALELYNGIAKGKTGERAFQLDFAQEVLNQLYTYRLSDDRKETSDIRIVIHDPITQYEPLLGFSIKSYIGGKPTLFNASKNSNIIFKINPEIDISQKDVINNFETYGQRIKWLIDHGFTFNYCKMNSAVFKTNLELIDSRLPEILSHLILYKYTIGTSSINDLTDLLNINNPCDFNIKLNPHFYTYKIKRLLVDAALGMKAGTLWSGEFNATGGYIAVKKDGELLCYHIYNWNDFQDYLINHTKIDLPDSSPDRCDYGILLSADEVEEEAGTFIKLNFQIRFK